MRKTREETAESRRRILREAARLYREKGLDGVGVAEIMEAAGMTHGGFYRHFPSKEVLIAEAMAEAFADRLAPLAPTEGATDLDLIRGYVETYLSRAHLEHPEVGCPVAAVGSESAHMGGQVSRAFSDGVARMVERVSEVLGNPKDAHRADALRLFATLVGAVVIARAVGEGASISTEVLDAVQEKGVLPDLLGAG